MGEMHATQFNLKVVNMSAGPARREFLDFLPRPTRSRRNSQLEAMGITVVSASGNSYADDPVPGASIPAVESTISVANTWATGGLGRTTLKGSSAGRCSSPTNYRAARPVQCHQPAEYPVQSDRRARHRHFGTWNSDAMCTTRSVGRACRRRSSPASWH